VTARTSCGSPTSPSTTREGKLYCCVVIDAFSRRVVGWAIDSRARADLATNALGMAIDSRANTTGQIPGAVIHGDHGTQFTSWAFTDRARRAGLLPSLGTVGDPYNALAEAFWARLQVEVLNRRRWNTPHRARPTRSSNTSKASTTAGAVTPPSAGPAP
jgi:putative transposase